MHMIYNTSTRIRLDLSAAGTLVVLLLSGALLVSAQSNRVAHFTVTDPLGRFVTGLGMQDFSIVENGTPKPVVAVSESDCSAAIAIVSDSPLAERVAFCSPADELIQTSSVSSALRYLAASTNTRRALVVVTGRNISEPIPEGIQVIEIAAGDLAKTVAGLRNQYLIQFESSSTDVEIRVTSPHGLPPLSASWK